MSTDFTVVLFDPKAKKQKEIRAIPRWVSDGIKVSKYMRHPTCPFCGLMDLGKEATERPTENHMRACTKRTLAPKPFHELNGVREERKGQFKGQGAAINIRYPIRVIRVVEVPILDAKGRPTGEVSRKFFCSYKWKSWETFDWVWSANGWIPWYEWRKE